MLFHYKLPHVYDPR